MSHDQMRPSQITQQEKFQESTQPKKEEPMTEMKRVPYRISDHEEACGMFEDFSCSSELEKPLKLVQISNGLRADK